MAQARSEEERREAKRWQMWCAVYAARFHVHTYGSPEGIADGYYREISGCRAGLRNTDKPQKVLILV
jgi:hypothetical protein